MKKVEDQLPTTSSAFFFIRELDLGMELIRMPIIEGQKAILKWSNRNATHYIKLGYGRVKHGDIIEVNVEHLTKGSHALVEITCDYCNEVFQKKYSAIQNSNNHFCSRDCQNGFLIGKPSWNKKEKIKLNCSYCQAEMERDEFDIKRSKNLFCSKNCSDNFKIGNGVKRAERFLLNCDNCNEPIERTIVEINRGKHHFCNKTCSDEFQTGKPNLKNRNGETVKCHQCEKSFHLAMYRIESQSRYFCGNECRLEWAKSYEFSKIMQDARENTKISTSCKECGIVFEKKQSEFIGHGMHYCSRNCLASHRIKQNNPNPKKQKIKVDCYTCGKEKFIPESVYKKNKYFFCSSFCYQEKRIEISDFKQTGTSIHLAINNLLDDMNISYENEKNFGYYSVDILLDDFNLGIEIMGDYWHGSPLKYPNYSVLNDIQIKNIKRDRSKSNFISKKYDLKILYLWEKDINTNIELCKDLINYFILKNGILDNYDSFNYKIINNDLKLASNLVPYWKI